MPMTQVTFLADALIAMLGVVGSVEGSWHPEQQGGVSSSPSSGAVSGEQQSWGGVSTGAGGNGECGQPQPLDRHCASVPQQQTSWPHGFPLAPADGSG
jgi:hypothetical protein